MFRDELELSAKLYHSNIVVCHAGFVAPEGAPWPPPESEPDFIVFEACDASLAEYIKRRCARRRLGVAPLSCS